MSQKTADFAVFGGTPLARLLAGLLAAQHGRRVIFVGESLSGYRLPRSIDLTVAPLTRPESWALLRAGSAETLKLVGRIAGRGASHHVDPIFFADGPAAREALSHIRQMAMAFDIACERLPPSALGTGRDGVILRDAIRLDRPVFEAGADGWLDRQGVARLRAETVRIAEDGSAEIITAEGAHAASQSVLADDAAILDLLPPGQWPGLLLKRPSATILTAPTKPLAAPVMLEVQTGMLLTQHAEGGIAGVGRGDIARVSAHFQALLGRGRQTEQAGQTIYTSLATRDGAPAVGRVGGTGADIVAGLGLGAAFLAPALARWLAGAASPEEARYFGGRLVDRDAAASPVADYQALDTAA
jgi:hypothetical protein